ncbi:MAG: hypothetical protein AABX01_06050 [Candidatus Micrarchaeota archaeon]
MLLLNGITSHSIKTNSALNIFDSGLRDINGKGYGVTSPKQVCFEKGRSYFTQEVVNSLPISKNEVWFICNDESLCGEGKKLEVSNSKITANEKVEAYSVICGNEQRATPPFYCISISVSAQKATQTCTDACDIQ